MSQFATQADAPTCDSDSSMVIIDVYSLHIKWKRNREYFSIDFFDLLHALSFLVSSLVRLLLKFFIDMFDFVHTLLFVSSLVSL